ncbi:Ribonuclease H-like protein [Senna tora]|uniref:Ribonuclease H-like protein n=1 Tax=Senna tora TaxID=362788 RepID=A0A834T3V3_9FABA|nr:Ribonuclease H-like protein [Senna tora]
MAAGAAGLGGGGVDAVGLEESRKGHASYFCTDLMVTLYEYIHEYCWFTYVHSDIKLDFQLRFAFRKAAKTNKVVNRSNVLDESEFIKWQAPNARCYEVNVDGSGKLDSNLISCRGLTHDYTGKSLLLRNWEVKIAYVQRDGNMAADMMAKYGHSLPYGAKLFTVAPDFCNRVIRKESLMAS